MLVTSTTPFLISWFSNYDFYNHYFMISSYTLTCYPFRQFLFFNSSNFISKCYSITLYIFDEYFLSSCGPASTLKFSFFFPHFWFLTLYIVFLANPIWQKKYVFLHWNPSPFTQDCASIFFLHWLNFMNSKSTVWTCPKAELCFSHICHFFNWICHHSGPN